MEVASEREFDPEPDEADAPGVSERVAEGSSVNHWKEGTLDGSRRSPALHDARHRGPEVLVSLQCFFYERIEIRSWKSRHQSWPSPGRAVSCSVALL